MTLCQHCRERPAHRPRGLCRPCFTDRDIRRQYRPIRGRYYGSRDRYCNAPLPEVATKAAPGSPEKIRVLAQRFARRESLFHPDDVKRKWLKLVS
jgi:hypothetical protein